MTNHRRITKTKRKTKQHKHITRYFCILLDKLYTKSNHKMHWSIVVCLLYFWRTRGTSTASIKSCTNCKFYMPPTFGLHNSQSLGKCTLYPYPDQTVHTLIVGMAEMDIADKYRYAINARSSDTMCGNTAQQFSPKIRLPPRYTNSNSKPHP